VSRLYEAGSELPVGVIHFLLSLVEFGMFDLLLNCVVFSDLVLDSRRIGPEGLKSAVIACGRSF